MPQNNALLTFLLIFFIAFGVDKKGSQSEQVLSFVMDSSDRIMVIENGRIVHEDSREDVDQDTIIKYLAV